MCTCASCVTTDKLHDAGFAAWPRGNPTGKTKAAAEYSAHVAHGRQWGAGSNGPAIPDSLRTIRPEPQFSCNGTFTPPQRNATAIRWNSQFRTPALQGVQPVSKPTSRHLTLARQLREQAKAERMGWEAIRRAA